MYDNLKCSKFDFNLTCWCLFDPRVRDGAVATFMGNYISALMGTQVFITTTTTLWTLLVILFTSMACFCSVALFMSKRTFHLVWTLTKWSKRMRCKWENWFSYVIKFRISPWRNWTTLCTMIHCSVYSLWTVLFGSAFLYWFVLHKTILTGQQWRFRLWILLI